MFYFVLDIKKKTCLLGYKRKIILCVSALCVPILFTDLFSSLLKF